MELRWGGLAAVFTVHVFDDYHYLESRILVFHVMCHDESTALSPSTMSTNAITDSEINAFIVAQNVKELNSVYFLSSCFVGAAAGILGLTNFAGFLFFFVSLLFSALCVSACRCVRAAQNHGDALINYTALFVILLIICLMEDGGGPYCHRTQYLGTSSSGRWFMVSFLFYNCWTYSDVCDQVSYTVCYSSISRPLCFSSSF